MTAATYDLTLFVSGASDVSVRAIIAARSLCDIELGGDCLLSVVDLDLEHALAGSAHAWVRATPTLVRDLPLPARHVIGDLSRTEHVLAALGLPAVGAAPRV
jgi:circadian clock protein KaiB